MGVSSKTALGKLPAALGRIDDPRAKPKATSIKPAKNSVNRRESDDNIVTNLSNTFPVEVD
jgi:hypothetical protein